MILIGNCTSNSNGHNAQETSRRTGEVKTVHLSVKNIRCNDCLSPIKRNLSAKDGVLSVETSLQEKDNIIVTFEPALISVNEIKAEIRNLGHQVQE
jgi:copper chaperone CopZ